MLDRTRLVVILLAVVAYNGRSCCALIFGSVILGVLLVIVVMLQVSFSNTLILLFGAAASTTFAVCWTFLWGGDLDLALECEKLVQDLPTAKAIWDAHRQERRELRAAHRERARAARVAQREERRQANAIVELTGPGTYEFEVVGESHYQKQLEAICGGRSWDGVNFETAAVLVLDNNNAHDPLAVRVDIKGKTVAYLSREDARWHRKQLRAAGCASPKVRCNALIVGGWDRGNGDRGHFGVRLDVSKCT